MYGSIDSESQRLPCNGCGMVDRNLTPFGVTPDDVTLECALCEGVEALTLSEQDLKRLYLEMAGTI